MPETEEQDLITIDANNITQGQIETLLYRYMRNTRGDEAPKLIAKALSNLVNGCGHGQIKTLVDESMRDHRYLLNEKMFFIFGMIAAAAKAYKDGWVDDRNKYSFKLAAEIFDSIQCDTCYKDDKNCSDCQYHKLRLGCR